MEFEGKHADVTDKIIGAYYTVYNTLGPGFAEKVYENALAFELHKSGCRVETQKPIDVYIMLDNESANILPIWL